MLIWVNLQLLQYDRSSMKRVTLKFRLTQLWSAPLKGPDDDYFALKDLGTFPQVPIGIELMNNEMYRKTENHQREVTGEGDITRSRKSQRGSRRITQKPRMLTSSENSWNLWQVSGWFRWFRWFRWIQECQGHSWVEIHQSTIGMTFRGFAFFVFIHTCLDFRIRADCSK